MNYEFRADVRSALARARDAAIERAHSYVGTEHLLAGLIAVPDCLGTRVLAALGAQPKAIREQLDALVQSGGTFAPGELPYTSRAKKTLELAMKEARTDGVDYVDTGHLLTGLLLEEKGVAANVLGTLGVTLDDVREVGS